MSPRSDYCLATSRNHAERIIRDLTAAEFSTTDVSLLLVAGSSASDGMSDPPWAGVPGLGPVPIPGEICYLAAGPIAEAMGLVTGGGVADGLADFGMPRMEAKRYVPLLQDHHVLVAVHTSNSDRGRQARDIFVASHATDIFTIMNVTTPRTPLLAPIN